MPDPRIAEAPEIIEDRDRTVVPSGIPIPVHTRAGNSVGPGVLTVAAAEVGRNPALV
jgi:hypothetical protein